MHRSCVECVPEKLTWQFLICVDVSAFFYINAVQKGASRRYHAVSTGRARTCAQQSKIRSHLLIGLWLLSFGSIFPIVSTILRSLTACPVYCERRHIVCCVHLSRHACVLVSNRLTEHEQLELIAIACSFSPCTRALQFCCFVAYASLGGKSSGYSRLHDNSL